MHLFSTKIPPLCGYISVPELAVPERSRRVEGRTERGETGTTGTTGRTEGRRDGRTDGENVKIGKCENLDFNISIIYRNFVVDKMS